MQDLTMAYMYNHEQNWRHTGHKSQKKNYFNIKFYM